jgi:hypothetical protein
VSQRISFSRNSDLSSVELNLLADLSRLIVTAANGNLISQVKILTQNRAVFSTSRSDNLFSPKIETTCSSPCAQEQRAFNGVDVVLSIAFV